MENLNGTELTASSEIALEDDFMARSSESGELLTLSGYGNSFSILRQEIAFDPCTDLFFHLKYNYDNALEQVRKDFDEWYASRRNMESVIGDYIGFVEAETDNLLIQPLYKTLIVCGIHDVASKEYREMCLGMNTHETALEILKMNRDQAQAESRTADFVAESAPSAGIGFADAMRKHQDDVAYQRQSQYGPQSESTIQAMGKEDKAQGIGLLITAGIGAASLGIAELSSRRKDSKLYKNEETANYLRDNFLNVFENTFAQHLSLLSSRIPGFESAVGTFDAERSDAFLENAGMIPQKKEEFLTQAFRLCPWNQRLLSYIFANYPEDRQSVVAAAEYFHVDADKVIEGAFDQMYVNLAPDENTENLKNEIRAIMSEFDITESPTLHSLQQLDVKRGFFGERLEDAEAFLEKSGVNDVIYRELADSINGDFNDVLKSLLNRKRLIEGKEVEIIGGVPRSRLVIFELDLPPYQKDAEIQRYCDMCRVRLKEGETPYYFIDTTVFGTKSKGVVVTSHGLYYSNTKMKVNPIMYQNVRAMLATSFGSLLISCDNDNVDAALASGDVLNNLLIFTCMYFKFGQFNACEIR